MRILVTGGRDYHERSKIATALERYFKPGDRNALLIHGGGGRTDTTADDWAKRHGIHRARVDSLWDWYDNNPHYRVAGPIRNGVMLTLQPELVLAFPGGNGTADMVRQAKAAGVPVEVLE